MGCAGRRPVADRRPPQPPAATGPSTPGEKPSGRTSEPAPPPNPASLSKPVSQPSAPRAMPSARPDAGSYSEEGLASWYGVPFHGRRAANGETYDMHKLTAAHRTLPFDSVVRVTNLTNERGNRFALGTPFTTGRDQVTPLRHIRFQSSKVRYFRKHHGWLAANVLRAFIMLSYILQMVEEATKWLLGHKRSLRRERVKAYWQVLKSGLQV